MVGRSVSRPNGFRSITWNCFSLFYDFRIWYDGCPLGVDGFHCFAGQRSMSQRQFPFCFFTLKEFPINISTVLPLMSHNWYGDWCWVVEDLYCSAGQRVKGQGHIDLLQFWTLKGFKGGGAYMSHWHLLLLSHSNPKKWSEYGNWTSLVFITTL